jgi:hypothetical protein
MIGDVSVPPWLAVDWLLGQFASQRKRAIQAYCQFVMEGQGLPRPWDQVQHQLLPGDDTFVEQYKYEKHSEELRRSRKPRGGPWPCRSMTINKVLGIERRR